MSHARLALVGIAGAIDTVDTLRPLDGFHPADQAARDRAKSLHLILTDAPHGANVRQRNFGMSKSPFKNSKSERDDEALDVARLCIATAAGERGFDDTRQSWLARAARRLNFTTGRVTSIWYRKGARLSAGELLQLMKARATELHQRQLATEQALHASRDRLQALAGRDPAAGVERPAAERGPGHPPPGDEEVTP